MGLTPGLLLFFVFFLENNIFSQPGNIEGRKSNWPVKRSVKEKKKKN